MTRSNRILTNIVSGGAGYLIPMAINLWSTPYVLGQLGQEAYGIQVLANVIIGYFMAVDMGLDIPIIMRVAETDARGLLREQSDFLQATAKIYFFISILGCGLILLSTPLLIDWFSVSDSMLYEGKVVFYLSGIGFLGSIVSMWGKAVFNGLHRYEISNGVNVASSLIGILLGLFLIQKGYGVIGFFSARVLGYILSALTYILIISRRIIKVNLRYYFEKDAWNLIKGQVGYGFLLRISGLVFSRIDQTLIAAWINVESVTVYSIPILIVTTLSGLVASSTHFVFPSASAMKAKSEGPELEAFFVKMTKFIALLCTLSFLPFIIWGSKFIGLWIDPQIAALEENLMFYLGIAFYLTSITTIGLNAFLGGIGYLKLITLGNLTKSVCLLIGFILMLKPLGLRGAAFVYLIANILDIIYLTWILKKHLKFDLSYLINHVYIRILVLALVLSIAMHLIRDYLDSWLNLIFATLVFLVIFSLGALLVGLISESERKLIKSYIMNVVKIGR